MSWSRGYLQYLQRFSFISLHRKWENIDSQNDSLTTWSIPPLLRHYLTQYRSLLPAPCTREQVHFQIPVCPVTHVHTRVVMIAAARHVKEKTRRQNNKDAFSFALEQLQAAGWTYAPLFMPGKMLCWGKRLGKVGRLALLPGKTQNTSFGFVLVLKYKYQYLYEGLGQSPSSLFPKTQNLCRVSTLPEFTWTRDRGRLSYEAVRNIRMWLTRIMSRDFLLPYFDKFDFCSQIPLFVTSWYLSRPHEKVLEQSGQEPS